MPLKKPTTKHNPTHEQMVLPFFENPKAYVSRNSKHIPLVAGKKPCKVISINKMNIEKLRQDYKRKYDFDLVKDFSFSFFRFFLNSNIKFKEKVINKSVSLVENIFNRKNISENYSSFFKSEISQVKELKRILKTKNLSNKEIINCTYFLENSINNVFNTYFEFKNPEKGLIKLKEEIINVKKDLDHQNSRYAYDSRESREIEEDRLEVQQRLDDLNKKSERLNNFKNNNPPANLKENLNKYFTKNLHLYFLVKDFLVKSYKLKK
jgi:hypothetical protein